MLGAGERRRGAGGAATRPPTTGAGALSPAGAAGSWWVGTASSVASLAYSGLLLAREKRAPIVSC